MRTTDLLHCMTEGLRSMERGYVKLWRKALDSGLLQNGPAWQLCGYLLLKASHKSRKSIFGGVVCELQAGEAVFGRSKAANDLCLSEQQIRTALNLLKKMEILTTRATNKFTVVSFVNWGKYQDEQPANNQQINQPATSTQPTLNHIQECKNINTSTDSYESVVDARASTPDQQPENLKQESSPALQEKPTTAPCPYEQIRDMYHDVFPEHPRVALLNTKRKSAVKARWVDAGKRLKELKRPDSDDERLDYFRRLFARAARSDFLTGKKAFPNGDVYLVSFDKLMSPSGFIGVIEGKYDNREVYA